MIYKESGERIMENEAGKVITGAIGGLLGYIAGLNWELIIIWFALVCTDIILGVIAANKAGEFRSRKMKEGLYDKVAELFLLVGLALIQRVAIINGINVPIAGVMTGVFCFKEFASILETNIKMGIDVPNAVKKWFDIARETIDRKEVK